VSAQLERAAAAALYWAQRRDPEAIRGAMVGLSDAERAEVVRLLHGGYMTGATDQQLRETMLELAAKSLPWKEQTVNDATGRTVSRVPGDAPIVLTDVPDPRAVARAAERRAEQDAEIKRLVYQIQQGETVRRYAATIPVPELRDATRANVALLQQRREEAAEPFRDLAELERDVPALLDLAKAAIPPQPTRYGRPLSPAEVAYEAAELEAMVAKQAAHPGCGSCVPCRTGYPCLHW